MEKTVSSGYMRGAAGRTSRVGDRREDRVDRAGVVASPAEEIVGVVS